MDTVTVQTVVDNLIDENKEVDFYQPRQVVLTNLIKGREVEFCHQTERLQDKIWLDFNDLLNPRRVLQNRKIVYKEESETAIRATYKKLVNKIPTGYQPYFRQELTLENFHTLIPLADQEKVLEEIFAFEIAEAEQNDFFFDDDKPFIFEISVPVNGEIAVGTVQLNVKTKGSEKSYKDASTPNTANVKRFRNFEVSQKLNYGKLSDLCKSLNAGVEGFKNSQIPIWLQVGLMNYYFSEFGESETKN